MLISIVIPVYQAEHIIPELLRRLELSLQHITSDYEYILVEDGSTDNSWLVMEAAARNNKNIKAIKLSRNFGQHYAITAGVDSCKGDWVVVMDCDLQDRPEEIPALYNKVTEGFDIVYAKRNNRRDTFRKKTLSKLFYKTYSFLAGIKYDGHVANFGIYSRKVIEVLKTMKEPMRAFAPMVRWLGFNKAFIKVEHGERFSGRSTYNLNKIFNLAGDIILAYSDKPLRIIIRIGFVISLISFLIAVYYLILYFSGRILVPGYVSIILSIWFLGGLIILNLGVIGLYISKIFAGIKNRPLYIIDKSINI
jgi:dolichol-phosphate mannosyltransferase